MSVLLGPLNAILCVLQNVALSFFAVLLMAFDEIIVSVGGYIDLLAVLLPSMPAPVTPPANSVLVWITWAYPLGDALATLTAISTVLIAIMAVRIALRWVKAM
jgi:hypothetical protein